MKNSMHFLSALWRFGVKQKVKIASFKTSVDVLTLSATPIPRTLYLALTGFRDDRLHHQKGPLSNPIFLHTVKKRFYQQLSMSWTEEAKCFMYCRALKDLKK